MHSIELVAEYAIHAADFASDIAPVLGPAIDWPKQAATAYGYLEHLWRRERKRREGNESIGQIEITGRHGSSIRFPSNVLERENTARRLLQFWDVANRGDIEVSARINVPPEEEEEEHPPLIARHTLTKGALACQGRGPDSRLDCRGKMLPGLTEPKSH